MLSNLSSLIHELTVAPKIQRTQEYRDIDPKISALVSALNKINKVSTIASCQGHIAGHLEPPYVYFYAPNHIVQQLTALIRANNQWFIPWEITGVFNEHNQLTFRLSSLFYDTKYLNLTSRFLYLGWHRNRVDMDIQLLAKIISDISDHLSCRHHHPNVHHVEKQVPSIPSM